MSEERSDVADALSACWFCLFSCSYSAIYALCLLDIALFGEGEGARKGGKLIMGKFQDEEDAEVNRKSMNCRVPIPVSIK